ncbi:MAG TPA: DUF2269 family protein [Candidatus Limnocylindria bacterium]|jgi:uncharacterized membrane protein
MSLYPAIVFIHAASILLFFIAHGASMAVGFRLKRERDPAGARALLDLSSWAMGWPTAITATIGVLAGIAAGIMGGWFGELWIWISLVLFVAVTGSMTPMAASRLRAVRAAAGTAPINPFSRVQPPAPEANPAELSRLLDEWNPIPVALLGLIAFLVILWLMLFKPF